jgi:hypothetical protein
MRQFLNCRKLVQEFSADRLKALEKIEKRVGDRFVML